MTPEKLARIQTHLRNEAAGTHPQEVMDAVLWDLIEDALESPSAASGKPVGQTPARHASGGDVSPTEKMSSPRAPGVVATDGRAPGGGDPVCLFGPGGDFRFPWPAPKLLSPPQAPGARGDARVPGGVETDNA